MNCNPTIPVQDVAGKTVYMGVFTTFNANSVTFDFSAWAEALGEGTFSVSLLRPGDTTPYAVAGLSIDGTLATWTFDATDTALAGYGRAFLSYVTPDAMDMTVDFDVRIAKNSAPAGETSPDPLETWYQQMLEASAQAQTSAQSALESATFAQESAEQASETAQSAEAFATRAETAAENAESSATQATSAASTATTAANYASTSATSAAGSAESAASSSAAAGQSAESAATSAQASAASASAAKTSKESAEQFAGDASQSATNAQASATTASNQASAAAQSATDANTAKLGAQSAQNAAVTSASNAAISAQNAANSASDAAQSAAQASTAAANAGASATLAESWAVGGTETRTGEDTNNAQYYATQAGDANTDVQAARTDIQDSIDGVAQEDTAQSELDVLRAISAQLQTIIDQGGSAGDLNGFSLSLGEGGTVIISYTDPDDETITGSATFPTNDTASEILTHITSVAQSLAVIAGKNEEV